MPQPAKSEVWLVDLPAGKGREQQGRRPALIASHLETVRMSVIIPVTSNLDAARFPYTKKIVPTKENKTVEGGLPAFF